ncbi:hypothetical protein BASA62_007834 [Batrachochytrium salamandrivorans]|nr:hypothetical protein BASA62_007834 [Batrachochytrium salamandrivorans]
MEILQEWREICLLNPSLYDYRNGRFICPEYIHDNKRPNLVEPPEEEHAQLGTTNKPTDARINSWEEMGDGKDEYTRSKHGQEFYQNREDEYRKLMKTAEGKKQHYEHIRRLEEKRDPNNLDPMLEYQLVIGAHLHDPLEPGPKIIKTESPEHLKSGLKKEYTDPVYGRKVGFNPVVDLVRYDDFEQSDDEQSEDEQFEGEQSEDESIDANGRQSDDEDSSQSQGSTEESTGTTGGQPDNETPPQPQVSTQESVDSNGEQSNDEDPFKAQEVLTQESTGTTGEQSNNEASSQSKVSIKDRRFDFQKLMNRFNGGGSTDTSSEQSNNEDPPQSKVPAKDRRFDFQWLRNRFNGGGSTDTSSEQSNNEDPPQSKVPAKDRRFDFQKLMNRFNGDGSTGTSE